MFCAFGKNHDIAMSMLVSWEHAKGKQQNNITRILDTVLQKLLHKFSVIVVN